MKKSLCIVFLSVVAQLSFAEDDGAAFCGKFVVDVKNIKDHSIEDFLSDCRRGDILVFEINTFHVGIGKNFNKDHLDYVVKACEINSIKQPNISSLSCIYRGDLRTLFSLEEGDNGWCDLGTTGNRKLLDARYPVSLENLLSSVNDCKRGNILHFHEGYMGISESLFCRQGSIKKLKDTYPSTFNTITYCEYRGNARRIINDLEK